MSDNYDTTLINAARSRDIPLISSKDALTWLDGRGDSQFDNLASAEKGKVTFNVRPGQGAVGLRAMMPMSNGAGTITELEMANQNVTYTTKAIKGVDYAVFDAVPGDYEITYSNYDPNPPVTPPTTPPGGSGTPGSNSDQSTQNSGNVARNNSDEAADQAGGSTNGGNTSDDEPAEPSTGNSGKPNNGDVKPENVASGGWPWWIWLLGVALLLGGFWFVVVRRRRHQE